MADFSFNLDDIMSDENHVYFEINDAEMLSIMDKLDKEIENNIKEEPPAAPVGPPSEFASVTEEEMDNIELGKNEKTTLSNTSWGVRRLKGEIFSKIKKCYEFSHWKKTKLLTF